MATPENARLNLKTASGNVAARLGVDPANMSYDERRGYNRELAAEILKFPNSFTPEIIAIANRATDPGALDDASFSWGDFGSETAANAVPTLDGFTTKLLVVVAVVAVAYVIANSQKSSPAPA